MGDWDARDQKKEKTGFVSICSVYNGGIYDTCFFSVIRSGVWKMKRNSEKWKSLKQGSLTVEAGMIMGVVLFSILSVLTGTKIVYNRVLITAKGYETAITGRESEAVGLWGTEDILEVELESLEPVSFLWKSQMLKKEMG